jgi:hypothetical protein
MIDVPAFHRIARTFAEDVYEVNRDQVSFISRDEVISVRLQLRDGQLFVIENEVPTPAAKWLSIRLARLNLLAERIMQHCDVDKYFIVPSGDALLCPEHPDFSGDDVDIPLDDVIGELTALLDWQPAGTTSVVYLTSDGGEGKTTLTNALAAQQAQRFKNSESPWLMLPVELGGRPFLRLDEVSIGTLVNKLRFSYLYFDSLMEFCRLGFIVLAIDGFEEMFIQDPAGDATSSLGRLLDSLDSSGRVLISARKAFFEFNSLADQTRLYDSLQGRSVAFSRVSLRRWTKEHFASYLTKRGIESPKEMYERVAKALQDRQHPLLTRPVLVEKLAVAVEDASIRENLLVTLEQAPAEYLDDVIAAILTRESTIKWIDRSGDVPGPLLTVDEHVELLSDIALEMWRAGGRVLRTDTLTLVAELFVEARKKSASVRHQVVKWAPHHALLVRRDDRFLEFDHEETFAYFLGRAVANELQRAKSDVLLALLRTSMLSSSAAQMACRFISDRRAAIQKLLDVTRREGPTSVAMENGALMLARLLTDSDFAPAQLVEHVSFPAGALSERKLSGVRFRSCTFGSLTVGEWKDVQLEKVSIERLVFAKWSKVTGSNIDADTCVMAIGLPESDAVLFDPQRIAAWLANVGMTAAAAQPELFGSDLELVLLEKCIHLFTRATEINEQSMKKRFGTRAPKFFENVLPALLAHGVIREIRYHGQGQQKRFELGGPLQQLTDVIAKSEGKFATFLSQWDAVCG